MRESIHALRYDFLSLEDTQSKRARCSGTFPNFIYPPRINFPRIFYPHPGYNPVLCVIIGVSKRSRCVVLRFCTLLRGFQRYRMRWQRCLELWRLFVEGQDAAATRATAECLDEKECSRADSTRYTILQCRNIEQRQRQQNVDFPSRLDDPDPGYSTLRVYYVTDTQTTVTLAAHARRGLMTHVLCGTPLHCASSALKWFKKVRGGYFPLWICSEKVQYS